MVKKVVRVAITFCVLVAGYAAYGSGFALLKSWVAPVSNVPLLPASVNESDGSREATDLAVTNYGPGHWTTHAAYRYYEKAKGYYIYWENQEKVGDGKQWKLWPVAVIVREARKPGMKSIIGDHAVLDFNKPFESGKSSDGGEATRVVHALITGNVRVRDDNGTPGDLSDDMTGDPMNKLEFDEAREEITSLDPDRRVVFRQKGMTVSGLGMIMRLRRREPIPPAVATAALGFEGVKTIEFLRDVEVDVEDVGHAGIVPGGEKPKVLCDKDGKVLPSPRRPGHIQCAGMMIVELPKARLPVLVGPPAPPDPTFATFDRNVVVRQGDAQRPDQLNCDHLWTLLLPPEPIALTKPATDAHIDDDMISEAKVLARTASAEGDQPVSNLSLNRAVADGHAVWLQSPTEGMRGLGNKLTYDKHLPEKPDRIYFWSERYTEVVKTEAASLVKDKATGKPKPQLVNTIRTKDVTIFQFAEGGPRPSVVARGPGTLETREVGQEKVERFASWQDKLEMFDEPKTENRIVRLHDHPRVSSPSQADITARDLIIATLRPKAPAKARPAPADEFEVVTADGKPPEPRPEATAAAGGDTMEIARVVAFNDAHLVSFAQPADPKTKKKAQPRKDVYARKNFRADFPEAPDFDPPATSQPQVPKTVASSEAPADPRGVDPIDPPKVAEAPAKPVKAPPPDPAMVASADDVWALVRRVPGTEQSEVEEAKLTGGAVVHQDPNEADPEKGGDVNGDYIHLNNKGGEGKAIIHAIGSERRPATAVTPTRTIAGPILDLDQGKDHAWVTGAGFMVLDQGETSVLDDTRTRKKRDDPKDKAKTKDKDKTAEAKGADGKPKSLPEKEKKKKPPMTIAWGKGPSDKTAWMHFYGQPKDAYGRPGPAIARFHSNVRGDTDPSDPNREDDTKFSSEELDVTFDGPIAFVQPKAEPGAKKEKEPEHDIAFLEWRGKKGKDVEILRREYDPKAHFLAAKKKIVGPRVTYDKMTGNFEVFDAGIVDLVSRGGGGNPLGGKAGRKPAEKPKEVDPKKPLPPLKLTHVTFAKGMKGRMAAEKGASSEDYSIANFRGSSGNPVIAIDGPIETEDATLDLDAIPQPKQYYRITAPFLQVISEPEPGEGEGDRTLLATWGGSTAQTPTKAIRGDRITYDSLSELTYVYGGNADAHINDQTGAGQPYTATRAQALKHNHITGETTLLNPKEFEIVDPNSGVRAASIYAKPTPGVAFNGYAKPEKAPKVVDPNDPMAGALKIRLPGRSNIERRGFYGH